MSCSSRRRSGIRGSSPSCAWSCSPQRPNSARPGAALLPAARRRLASVPAPRPRAALWNATRLTPEAFAFLFLAAAAGDGFAQVVGQWLGRRKLAPRVSPAKTVEGFLGGLCAAGSVAAFASTLVGLSPAHAASIGLLTGVAGLVGDLAASWVKRRAGIKDYSGALPGQGGFLDRFDSLLGALAFAGWCL